MSQEQEEQDQGHYVSFNTASSPSRASTYNSYQPRRSISEMVNPLPAVPQWQPDEDVNKCSVCNQDFSIFFRKHHCRKCGKVVCGDCSRHRITLPRRYIVQPPWIDLHLADPRAGESVRVCNPCVPDPWTPTSPLQQSPRPLVNHRFSMPPSPSTHQPQHHIYFPPQHAQRRSVDVTNRPNRNSGQFFTNSLAPFYQPQSLPPPSSQPPHRYSVGPDIPTRRNFPLPPRPDQPAQISQPTQPVPRPPRRVVKEEDECPVCGIELAPGQELREQHITACIATRFGSPAQGTSTASTPAATAVEAEASSGTPPTANRLRAQSYRSRGLYSYKATEKDCTDNDGQEQECPICFEEFQAGDMLGRLECLCRFHHSCIREWWVRKGPGMCPVHASHE